MENRIFSGLLKGRFWISLIALAIVVMVIWPVQSGKAQPYINYKVEVAMRLPYMATDMVWTPDGRIFYTERETGNVRVILPEWQLQPEPVIHLSTDALGERGLIGIALDPDYENNGYIWVYHTYPGSYEGQYAILQRVVRFHEENGVGSDPLIMLEVPSPPDTDNGMHYAGSIQFDEKGYLYVSIGDNSVPDNSQNLEVYQGKIHRFKVVGDELQIPDDNPWPGYSAFAMGLRNPFDFVFDPYSDYIFATENGPSCDDEVNLIQAGNNYGWHIDYEVDGCDDSHQDPDSGYTYPLVYYTPTIAPVGVGIYTGDQIPEFQGNIFFCAWNDGKMRRLILDSSRTTVIVKEEVDTLNALCHTAISNGPDGALYFIEYSSINRLVGMDG